jgi:hypothetical protein
LKVFLCCGIIAYHIKEASLLHTKKTEQVLVMIYIDTKKNLPASSFKPQEDGSYYFKGSVSVFSVEKSITNRKDLSTLQFSSW